MIRMGLDMYLYGVKSNYWLHDYNIGQVKTVIEVGYWRKANQIHNWFVENIQNGIDDCDYHREVREEDLRELPEDTFYIRDLIGLSVIDEENGEFVIKNK